MPLALVQHRLLLLLRISVTVGLVAACIWLTDLERIPNVIRQIEPALFAVALLLNILGTIVIPAALTQQALLQDRIQLRFTSLVAINFAMRFYVLILPRPASVAMRWYRYTKGGKARDALALMAFERVVQMLVLGLGAAIFLSLERKYLPAEAAYILVSAWVFSLASAFALILFLSQRLSMVLGRLLDATLGRWSIRVSQLWEAVSAFNAFKTPQVGKILFLSVASYVFFVASPYVLSVAMGMDIDWQAIAWIRSVVFILTLVPISIGGAGVREGGFIVLLSLYGIPQHEALTLALMLYAIQLCIGLIGIFCETFFWFSRRTNSDLHPG